MTEDLSQSLTKDAEYGPSAARWWVLGSFALLTASNGMMYIQFAPVRSEAAAFYGVTGDKIDLLAMIFLEIYVVIFA